MPRHYTIWLKYCIEYSREYEYIRIQRNDKHSQRLKNVKDYNTSFKRRKLSFPCFNICNEELAIKSADNFRYLRKKGVTIRKKVDLIIGTFCIENDIELLHKEKDYEPMGQYLNLKIRK